MVSVLSSKIGDPEGFAPIPSSGELPCDGKLHRRYSQEVGFQISLRFCVLRNEGFYGGRNAHPATDLIIISKPTAEDIHRHSWALDMDGCWFTMSSSAL